MYIMQAVDHLCVSVCVCVCARARAYVHLCMFRVYYRGVEHAVNERAFCNVEAKPEACGERAQFLDLIKIKRRFDREAESWV